MIRFIPQTSLIEGRWRNGQGVSWEIASFKREGAADFSWRFAKARIETDVPFSIYPGMDRVFMMIEGQGMDLEFEGGKVLQVHETFVPHAFSCDVPLHCKLLNGPSVDLNLFTARGTFEAECEVFFITRDFDLVIRSAFTVVFVLEGPCSLGGHHMETGDSAVLEQSCLITPLDGSARLFVGQISGV